MWNGSISLPVKRMAGQNRNGFVTDERYEFTGNIPAQMMDASRSEQVSAHQMGYTADIVVSIMACNYNGAGFFVDDATGIIYDIRRTFIRPNSMTIELAGERRENNAC